MKKITLILLISLCATLPLFSFGNKNEVKIRGYVSQGYLYSNDNNFNAKTSEGTFHFNEIGINFQKKISRKLHVGLQLSSRDLGNMENNTVRIDWAFADYQWKPYLGLRVGKAKVPVGMLSEYWDLDMVRTNIFLPLGVYPETFRDVFMTNRGLGIYGDYRIDILGKLKYNMMIGSDEIDTKGTFGRYVSSDLQALDMKYKFNSNLTWETPLEGLSIGGSYIQGDFKFEFPDPIYGGYAEGHVRPEVYIGSVHYRYNKLNISGEYLLLDINHLRSLPRSFNHPVYGPITVSLAEDQKSMGFYGKIDYRINDMFEIGAYYTEFYPDKDDKDGKKITTDMLNILSPQSKTEEYGWQKDICLSLRTDLMSSWIIKTEIHKMNGTASLFTVDQEDPSNVEEDWFLFAAKLTYLF